MWKEAITGTESMSKIMTLKLLKTKGAKFFLFGYLENRKQSSFFQSPIKQCSQKKKSNKTRQYKEFSSLTLKSPAKPCLDRSFISHKIFFENNQNPPGKKQTWKKPTYQRRLVANFLVEKKIRETEREFKKSEERKR